MALIDVPRIVGWWLQRWQLWRMWSYRVRGRRQLPAEPGRRLGKVYDLGQCGRGRWP